MSKMDTICHTAEQIVDGDPDPVVRFRLLRDVLCTAPDCGELERARQQLRKSRWVQELESEQWEDGSWGTLHSKDYNAKQKIPKVYHASR